MINIKSLIKDKTQYKLHILEKAELLKWGILYPAKKESLEKRMAEHRGHAFQISDFIKESPKKSLFIFIFIVDTLVCLSRGEWNRGICFVSAVNVNPKFRGQGWCKTVVSVLIREGFPKTHKYTLYVDPKNIPAINCYKSIGFKEEINNSTELFMVRKIASE